MDENVKEATSEVKGHHETSVMFISFYLMCFHLRNNLIKGNQGSEWERQGKEHRLGLKDETCAR